MECHLAIGIIDWNYTILWQLPITLTPIIFPTPLGIINFEVS